MQLISLADRLAGVQDLIDAAPSENIDPLREGEEEGEE